MIKVLLLRMTRARFIWHSSLITATCCRYVAPCSGSKKEELLSMWCSIKRVQRTFPQGLELIIPSHCELQVHTVRDWARVITQPTRKGRIARGWRGVGVAC